TLSVSPLAIPTGVPGGTLNTAYSTTFTATGGTGLVTFASVGAPLPNGLTLTSGGVLSGTPKETGNFTISIRATDSATTPNVFTNIYFNVFFGSGTATTLGLGYPSITGNNSQLSTLPLLNYQANFSVTGGTGPYTWSITGGSLPPGLALLQGAALPNGLASSAAVIAGGPQATGTYSFTVQVTDSLNNIGIRTLTLPVTPLLATNFALITAPAGVSYSKTFKVAGGTAPYTFRFSTDPDIGTVGFTSTNVVPPGLAITSTGTL